MFKDKIYFFKNLISGVHGMIIYYFRVLLEATTDIDAEELLKVTTPYAEEEVVEVEFMEDIEDVGLDNTEVNCHKCVKASFKFRKVLY